MNILLIGDIVGKPGRHAVHQCLKKVRADHSLDFLVANGENLAGISGIQPEQFKGLMDLGVDVVTSGNHIWGKKEVHEIIRDPRLLRPHNYPVENPGTGVGVYDCKGTPVAVVNLMGRTGMNFPLDCPFKAADRALAEIGNRAKVILVDMHAEATSEKRAMGWHLDGKVSSVTGTHTHIMTADEEILPGGTAYLTDIGMSGCPNSVIGVKKEIAIKRFQTSMPARFENAEELPYLFQGVVVTVEPLTGKATKIERIRQMVN